jgi:CheY-like chemotaxis protein
VLLPAANRLERAAERRGAPSVPAARRARILFIDDEPLVVLAFEQILASAHDVVGMTDARKALDLLSGGSTFDLVFCDLMMPRMSGMEFGEELARVAPAMRSRLFFTTAGVFTPEGSAFLDQQSNPLIEKPFDEQQLRSIVSQVVLSAPRPAAAP